MDWATKRQHIKADADFRIEAGSLGMVFSVATGMGVPLLLFGVPSVDQTAIEVSIALGTPIIGGALSLAYICSGARMKRKVYEHDAELAKVTPPVSETHTIMHLRETSRAESSEASPVNSKSVSGSDGMISVMPFDSPMNMAIASVSPSPPSGF